jgi:hypothetical protein
MIESGVVRLPYRELPPHLPFSGLRTTGSLAVVILWLVWQHRVHARLRALTGAGLRFTPGWAVGWWFVPGANVYKPFQVMREASEAGPEEPAVSRGMLGAWWLLLVVPLLITIAIFAPQSVRELSSSFTDEGNLLTVARLSRLSSAINEIPFFVGGVLAIMIVGRVARRIDGMAATIPPRPDEWVPDAATS